jgi:hypothetical protein
MYIDKDPKEMNYTTRIGKVRGRSGIAAAVSVLLLVLLLAASPQQVFAQAKVGTTGAQFLELGISARAMGMAEAFTSVSNDVSAVYYNPAGLTSLLGREAMFTYIKMPAGINYGFAGYAMPLEAVGGVLGVAAYGLSTGNMTVTTYEQGTEEGTGQTFLAQDLAVSMSYGRYLTDRFSIGLTVRYIGEYFADKTASGWSADVGTSYDTGFRGFKIAMIISNFGPDLKLIDKAYPLPINFKFGGCINIIENTSHLLTVAAEGTHPSDNLEKYNAGLEYTYKDRFVLRGGRRFHYNSDGFTFGGGVRVPFRQDKELRFDYAYQDFGLLTEVHRFSMSIAF